MVEKYIKKLDYLIVLCPEINPEDDGKFFDFKKGLYLGGKARMMASYKAYTINNNLKLILVADYNGVNGGVYKESQRTNDMKNYLLKLGVPSNSMQIVNSLPCTRHNIVAIFNSFKNLFKNKNVGLLTNLYHMPRALLFWSELKEIKEYKNIPNTPVVIVSENLIETDLKNKKDIRYIRRLELEMQGIIDLSVKQYKDGCINIKNKKLIIRNEYSKIIKQKGKLLLTPDEFKKI